MTLKEVIDSVDMLSPNSFTNEMKTKWLNEIEGKVQAEVFLLAHEDIITYSYNTCEEHELLVKAPYDKIYEPYLLAKIQFAEKEYNDYQNSMQLFNHFWAEFVCWFARVYRPADVR